MRHFKHYTGVRWGFSLAFLVFGGYSVLSGTAGSLFNISGLLVVLGGTAAAALIQFSFDELQKAWRAVQLCLQEEGESIRERLVLLERLSLRVKKEGLVPLENEAAEVGDEFLCLALQLAVDQVPEDEARRRLEAEIALERREQERNISLLLALANYSPAFGLVGTLLGLTAMFSQIGNAAELTQGMAVAVLTTLYGIILSNIVFTPMAGKLRLRLEQLEVIKQMTLEAVMSLAKEENPVFLAQRLSGYKRLAAHS